MKLLKDKRVKKELNILEKKHEEVINNKYYCRDMSRKHERYNKGVELGLWQYLEYYYTNQESKLKKRIYDIVDETMEGDLFERLHCGIVTEYIDRNNRDKTIEFGDY